MRRATPPREPSIKTGAFQFTPVMRRATGWDGCIRRRRCFNSRPSCDGRPLPVCRDQSAITFQFTPVMRRATGRSAGAARRSSSFNSRPSCAGRPIPDGRGLVLDVSIHARHATGDLPKAEEETRQKVSIHARHATGDSSVGGFFFIFRVSIHARHATGDLILRLDKRGGAVSIHARHATGDPSGAGSTRFSSLFQFTPVMRRATGLARRGLARCVSIHARHATGDTPSSGDRASQDVSIHARHATGD